MDNGAIKRLAWIVMAGNCALVAIYLVHIWRGESSWILRVMFDLDGERTIPAWYTSAQLLLTGALFLRASLTDGDERVAAAWFLVLIGSGFVFLSADEVVGIHESVTVVFRERPWLPRFSGNHGIWIPIYLALGIGIVSLTAKTWLRMWRTKRRGSTILFAGALVFLAGAVGLEILSYGDLREGVQRRLYVLEVALEEGLELFGASLMLIGSAIVFRSSRPPPAPADVGGAASRGHDAVRPGDLR